MNLSTDNFIFEGDCTMFNIDRKACNDAYRKLGMNISYTEVANFIKKYHGAELPKREEIVCVTVASLPVGSKPKEIQNSILHKYGLLLKTSSIRKTVARFKKKGVFDSVVGSKVLAKTKDKENRSKFQMVLDVMEIFGCIETKLLIDHIKNEYGVKIGKSTVNSAKQAVGLGVS